MYSDKLADIVNEYNKTHHRTIKMKPIDVKSSTYIDFGVVNNDKYPKLEVHDHVRILKCKYIFAKVYTPNWSKEVFVIKKSKNYCSVNMPNKRPQGLKEMLERFMKEN